MAAKLFLADFCSANMPPARTRRCGRACSVGVGGARLGLDARMEPVDAPSKEFPNEAHFSRYQIPISALDSRLPPSNGFCAAADEGSQVRPVGGTLTDVSNTSSLASKRQS